MQRNDRDAVSICIHELLDRCHGMSAKGIEWFTSLSLWAVWPLGPPNLFQSHTETIRLIDKIV